MTNVTKVENLIKSTKGKFFGVNFTKRTTGELRNMNCQTGVTKFIVGGAKAYDAESKNLMVVCDVKARGYRSIPLDAIHFLTIDGVKHQID